MPTSKRQSEPSRGKSVNASSVEAPSRADLVSDRDQCLARLNAVASRVQELCTRTSADLTRALHEAQSGAQMRQQALLMDYQDKIRQASMQIDGVQAMNEVFTRCASDLQLSNDEARKALDEAQQKARAAYDSGIDQTNRDWDAICLDFVDLLRKRLGRVEPAQSDPAELAEIGQSLTWIASLMRKSSSS
jgi:hypothetical protein